jgi:PAS domain S-box-containing protein
MPERGDAPWDAIVGALDCGLIVLDRDARVIAWNAWLATASRIPTQHAVGKPLEELMGGAISRRLASAIADALEAGTSSLLTHSLHHSLFPLETPAGRDLVHNVSVRPIGQLPRAQCLIQITDVTVAAHREQVLRNRLNARYEAVVGNAPDTILTLDAEGLIQLANPATFREFGYASQALIGQPITVLLNEKDWRAVWTAVLKGEGVNRPTQMVARRKDGQPTYLEVSASLWHSDSRVFVTVILRDVNERHAAEEALRQLNHLLEQRVSERTADRDRMWRLSTDVMMVAQFDGAINAVNPAWTQLFGWDEAALVGTNITDFIQPEDRAAFADVREELSRSLAPRLFELRLLTRDGGNRLIEWSAVAADGLLQAVGRDVTAARQAEDALRSAENSLRQAQKMEAIGQLTGGIAHDFNNLLTGIIGSMRILERRLAAGRYDETQRFMDAAVTSAHRAAALTHRLLAFARRQPLNPKSINSNRLIRGMEDLLHRTLGERVALSTELQPSPWPIFVDESQLENALLNLAINARDAMPEGGNLTIATRNVTFSEASPDKPSEIEAGDFIEICVSDTGMGIAPEVISKVFEPFFTTKPLGKGTGLGLSMIYGFVRQSNGHVRIESIVGEGTRISLYLPRHGDSAVTDDIEPSHEMPEGAGETVLLVEDDPSVRLLVGEVLRELGYVCIEVSEGEAAVPMLASNIRLDLLITDLGLPGLNGLQLAEVARQHRPELNILFMTGYAEHTTSGTHGLGPGKDMVTKPFALDALALKIQEMIASTRSVAGDRILQS